MVSTMIKTLKSLAESDDGDDKKLLEIVNQGSKRTEIALQEGAKENEKFMQYLVLQNTIGENAEKFLAESQSTFQKFTSLIKNPTPTGLQRLGTTLSAGLYKPKKLTPETVGSLVLDLYSDQVRHLGAIETSHDLLQNRRKIIYGVARDAAESIGKHSLEYQLAQLQIKRIGSLFDTLDNFVQGGEINLNELRTQLDICNEANLFDGSEILERIDAKDEKVKADLYLLREDVDLARAHIDDRYRNEGLEVKGASTLLQGLDLQKRQFDETIKGMGVQVQELRIDLKYTKELARNTFYLSTAQGVSQSAMESFLAYKEVMNNVQKFNSLGARIMLDRVGFLLTSPFFDPEGLAEAKDELKEAASLFGENEKKFHNGVGNLVERLNIHGGYQPNIQGGYLRND